MKYIQQWFRRLILTIILPIIALIEGFLIVITLGIYYKWIAVKLYEKLWK